MKNHTYLVAEVVKGKNGHTLEITKEMFVFQENETYNIRQKIIYLLRTKIVLYYK